MSIARLHNNIAKPFVKWADGKSQLLNEIERRLPFSVVDGEAVDYVEPFALKAQKYKKAITSEFARAGTSRSNAAKV